MFTTAVTVGTIEGIARIVDGAIWTSNIHSSALAVWLPQGFIMLNTFLLIFCHIISCAYLRRNEQNLLTRYLVHIILPLHLISFGLLYFLFPAIILVLAYPTQMIATATFVLSYLFATILSASLFNICKVYIEPQIQPAVAEPPQNAVAEPPQNAVAELPQMLLPNRLKMPSLNHLRMPPLNHLTLTPPNSLSLKYTIKYYVPMVDCLAYPLYQYCTYTALQSRFYTHY